MTLPTSTIPQRTMNLGSIPDRAASILVALSSGLYTLVEGTYQGRFQNLLISDDGSWNCLIPDEVIKYMTDHELIEQKANKEDLQ